MLERIGLEPRGMAMVPPSSSLLLLLLLLLLCSSPCATAQRCVQDPERRELLLRAMADLAEEMARPLWSGAASPPTPTPTPTPSSPDSVLCEKSHAACSAPC